MSLDTSKWSEAAVTAFAGQGSRPIPLVRSGQCAAGELRTSQPALVFPSARSPQGVFAGLLLYLNCWDEAHDTAQSLETLEGSYWHALIHRMEPDAWNSEYWFRRVGRHAIFQGLWDRAVRIAAEYPEAAFRLSEVWDPCAFAKFCDRAIRHSGSADERLATEIHTAEWQLLMEWCN
jgi:hypothetical protein